MLKSKLKKNVNFFTPRSHFTAEEWILKYQIKTMLLFSFFFGIGVYFFSFFRFLEGNYIVAFSQFIFSTFSLYGFFKLRENKKNYQSYAIGFFFIFFFYTGIIFFYVPENTLNILWVVSAPILIFFFLNRTGGIAMFLLIIGFIVYLVLSKYHYSLAEYITLVAAFLLTSYIMYMYESLKEAEHRRLTHYNRQLQHEVKQQTLELCELNETLEKRVQEEVKKSQSQEQMMLSQNRMANMGMMIDSIAHQWRQPLMHINAILMNISRVTETKPNDIEYIDEKIDNIFNITQHMNQTIHDFRTLFSPKKEKQTFEISALIQSILTLMKGSLKNIELEANISQNISLHSYQNELSQVILTVLQNCVEALNEKSIKNPKISIDLVQTPKALSLNISDNAQGIDDSYAEKIFEPYFSTKKEKSGSGLGLYIAKIIMERSIGGEIYFTNQNDGVQFTIKINKKL